MIIGINGVSGSGKDTVGDYLRKKDYFEKFSFAAKMKKFTYDLFKYIGVKFAYLYDKDRSLRKEVITEDKTVIDYWIAVGNSMRAIDPEVWIHPLKEVTEKFDNVVVTDMRFPNEAQAIKDLGGFTLLVLREGSGDKRATMDKLLGDWKFDAVIHNDGTLEDLHKKIDEVYNGFKNRG